MHAIDQYLRELLYEYDCVTVPGLGGFIAQSRPSRLMRDKRRIYPPSRIIGFNAMLQHDDGNLSSCIAREENISYKDAVARLDEFTSDCRKAISTRGSFMFEGIGSLTMNPEGSLVFQQLTDMNFSAPNFGLESIYVHTADVARPRERLSERPADRKPVRKRSKTPESVRWTLAITLPVIVFLLYGIISPASMQRLHTNYSSIISGIIDTTPAHQPEQVMIEPEPSPVVNPPVVEETKVETVVAKPEPVVEKPVPIPDSLKESRLSVKPSVPDPSLSIRQRYFIIGGCFEDTANARKFKSELRRRGFEAEEAGVNQRGHLRISYKSFLARHEAIAYLQEIRMQENPSAWLLKY